MTQFHTNIDCAQQFMSKLNTVEVGFLIGDTVEVFKESHTVVQMKVVARTWKQGRESLSLHVELHLASQFVNITAFENFLKSRGLPIH